MPGSPAAERLPWRPRSAATTFAVLLAVSACSQPTSVPAAPSARLTTVDDAQLDAARTAFDVTRAALLVAQSQLSGGATALDAQDTAAVAGAYDTVRKAEAGAATKAAAAASAAGRLTALVSRYGQAVATLGGLTSPELSAAQRAALIALAAAAQAEVASLRPLARGSWTPYRQLQSAQALWISRAGAGYYPHTDDDRYDPARAGGAYVVLVDAFRPALDAERARLATASVALAGARTLTARALSFARTAFG